MRLGGALACDAGDLCPRHQPRDVLRAGAPTDCLAQIIGDAAGDELERQIAALDLAIEADDVQAVARRDGLLGDGAGGKREQRALELSRGLSGTDLAEIAALRGRRTGRVEA